MKSVVKFHGFLGKLSGLSGFELGFSRDPWWLYRIYVGSCGFYMGLKKSIGPTTDRALKPLYEHNHWYLMTISSIFSSIFGRAKKTHRVPFELSGKP